jgi:hypothetical protein
MRLLEIGPDGRFSLTKDIVAVDEIPKYAILSHTWGSDEEEVTFQDLVHTTENYKDKIGFQKIQVCGQLAAIHGLKHFWVDTCCIDKSNNTELSTAINSMFRWYQNATICYVYLPDIQSRGRSGWEAAFRRSRWFTRGWTLQELIASPSVEFYSSDKHRLGDKTSLERLLCEITGISARAFQSHPLLEFSEAERMSWLTNRQTKLPEDMAYCMLGIFGVHMPLIYGEGKHNALRRLREEIAKSSPILREISSPLKGSSLGIYYRAQAFDESNNKEYRIGAYFKPNRGINTSVPSNSLPSGCRFCPAWRDPRHNARKV